MMDDVKGQDLEIIFQDAHYVTINKPAGMLVHRTKIDPAATQFVLQMVRDQIGQHVYPVHRLDKPTSGVLVFGLSKDAARDLVYRFEAREVAKSYRAIVRGYVDDEATIDYPLKEILDKKTDKKAQQDKPPQPAVTVYRCIAQVELPFPVGRYDTARYSLVDLHPKTGRKNQLRRHMKHIFHPILGDRKFGDWRHNALLETQFGCRQLLLHASALTFKHPYADEVITITARLPEHFRRVGEEMGFGVAF